MNKIDELIYEILVFSMGVDEEVHVLSADEPKQMRIGFTVWYIKNNLEYSLNPTIRLADLKRSRGSDYIEYFKSHSGRVKFASYLQKCVNSDSEMKELKNMIIMNEALE